MNIEPLNLKRLLVEALVNSKKVRTWVRPSGIKFNEETAIFLSDINEHTSAENATFRIGELIDPNPENICCWLKIGTTRYTEYFRYATGSIPNPKGHSACCIAGFFELIGHMEESQIKIKETFCAIASKKIFREAMQGSDESKMPLHQCIFRASWNTSSPILLFWVDGLKKI